MTAALPKFDVARIREDFPILGLKVHGKPLVYLDKMPPYQGGGDMISSVTFEKTTYNVLPYKFEAGTPDIAGVIGLGAAVDYLNEIGMDNIATHEHDLVEYGTQVLQ